MITYIIITVIFVLSFFFLYLVYKILSPYHEKIYVFASRAGKNELVFIFNFLRELGPSISAVAVVALFIPIEGVEFGMISFVFVSGIILSRFAKMALRYIK